ncbi:MAG: sugar porter family MFS transporter [Paramuribaculum sp.]
MSNINRLFVYFICLVSALGGLLIGYDWVVIGGAKPFYEIYFGITGNPGLQGLAMSIALVGCLVGASAAGILADRIGRRALLIVAAAIFLISAWATGAADGFTTFLIARLAGGVAIGIASGLSPMYIAEVAPAEWRGRLVALNQLTIVIGILSAQIANMFIADEVASGLTPEALAGSWNVAMGWRHMFWGAAYPAAAFLILALFIPESPRWLIMTGRTAKATKVLTTIGGPEFAQESERSITSALDSEKSRGGLSLLFSRPFRKVLILGVVIAVFQQWCGTNVIFNYAQEIFSAAGYELGDLFFQIVVTGITNLVFTIVAMYTVDRLGRRALMLLGAGGLGGIYLILGACYLLHVTGPVMVGLVVLAIACYAMSLGPVTWVLLSEIFPDKVRGVAMGVATFALWAGSASLTFSFPYLNSFFGAGLTFWTYSAICFAALSFLIRRCPETRGRSLEQIRERLIG